MNKIEEQRALLAQGTQGAWSGGIQKTVSSPTGLKGYIDTLGQNVLEFNTRDDSPDWKNVQLIVAMHAHYAKLLDVAEAAQQMAMISPELHATLNRLNDDVTDK